MRGKLRDKQTINKRDLFKREVIERKRPSKRENRLAFVFYQELEDQDDYELDGDGENETDINASQTK